jgi:hypothetical protein
MAIQLFEHSNENALICLDNIYNGPRYNKFYLCICIIVIIDVPG